MQGQLSAPSEPPVTVLSPLDALAAELGAESARVERELRRELALGLAELRQERAEIREEREAMRRQFAELELRVATAERERDEAVRARLASLRNGENGKPGTSVTIDDVLPALTAEIARQYEAQPKPPDAEALTAAVRAEVDTRLPDVVERAVKLVRPLELPDIGAMVDHRVAGAFATVRVPQDGKSADPEKTAALVRDEVAKATDRIAEAFATPGNVQEIAQSLIDKALAALPANPTTADIETAIEKASVEYTKAVLQPQVAAAEARIASELDHREAGLVERIDALPKPLEAEEIGELVEAAAETVIDRCMPDIAQRAAGLIPAPDIAAAVAGQFDQREGGVVDRAVAVAREEIQKSADGLRTELTPRSDAEILSLARDAVKGELAMQPPSLTVEQVRPIIDLAIAPLREAIDELPTPVDVAEVKHLALDAAEPLIAEEIAAISKRIDELPKPLGLEEVSDAAADKVAAVLGPDIASLNKRIDDLPVGITAAEAEGIAANKVAAARQEVAAEIPTADHILVVARAEVDRREGDIAQKAAALVVVPEVKALTPEDMRPIVKDEVKAAVEAIPPAEPGHTPTEAEFAPLVDAAVEKRWATLPPPEKGDPGPPGKLPIVRTWRDGVHYESVVVTHKGGTYQAVRDTGREPPHEDWICLAEPGENGKDGRSLNVRSTYSETETYRALDVVALDGSSFVARHDDPGPCPGDGWQLMSLRGKAGKPGVGTKGDKGDKGDPGPGLKALETDDANGLLIAVNADGTTVIGDLHPMLSRI